MGAGQPEAVIHFICATCGVQFAATEAAPASCPVCEDERQYVPESGQQWTTLEALREDHANRIAPEGELTAIGTEPKFAIGQRALLVPWGERQLLWDCVTLLDDDTVAEVERRGGLAAIAISHPHYYSAMVDWGRRFGCPVHLHADDAEWIMQPDPLVELWDGERKELGDGLTLIRCGGHFEGAQVIHWPAGAEGRGALLAGDILYVVSDRRWLSFMYSYPNLIPLNARAVRRIAAALAPFAYDRIYTAWLDRTMLADAQAGMARSVERYINAIQD
jgi:hypothetical protein